MQDIQS